MKRINHYTINSRNNRVSRPEDVSKEMYFYLKGMVKDAQTHKGAQIMDNTVLKLTCEPDCYVATLYLRKDTKEIPVLVTSGTKEESKKMYVWDNIIDTKNAFYPPDKVIAVPPATPFILDFITPLMMINPKISTWTGDFTKCLGWILMFPEAIR